MSNIFDSRPTVLALVVAIFVATCADWAVGQTVPGTSALNLMLTDDSGVPVAGASVSIRKTPVFFTNSEGTMKVIQPGPNATAFVSSDTSGGASAPVLEPGDYLVCVTVPPASGVVSPCKWDGVWKITVMAGQNATATPLVLRKGGVVRVHVIDSQHLLPNPESLMLPSFTLGVLNARGVYIGMKSSEEVTAAGRDYSIVVPLDTPLTLSFFSRRFRFADQSGAELTGGGTIPLTIASGQASKDIYLSVIGPATP